MTDPFGYPPAGAARIAILDDEPGCVRGLTRLLHKEGYILTSGWTDPDMALKEFVEFKPDLLLLDWHMDTMSGLQVLQALQAQCSPENMPPVIVLTGDVCPETRKEALRAGVSDFLTKPIDETEAPLRIRNLLRLRHLHLRSQTENRRLEEVVESRTAKLRQTIDELEAVHRQVLGEERMRALAAMAGGVAHDFNNALTVITGYSELYADEQEIDWSPERVKEVFKIIALSSRDAGEIVRRLREFYRPYTAEKEDRQPGNLTRIAREGIELSRPKWETQTRAKGICVTVTTDFQELPEIPLAAAEIREILINLIFNAVDAMPQGGQITVRTRLEGDEVLLEVEDTGTGMTEETRRRCLEPFYTTKGNRGTGLGLAIMYGILQRHHGSVDIHTVLNQGTRMTVRLPREVQGDEDLSLPEKRLPVVQHLKILVVDDDPNICEVVNRFLSTDGHTITVASNGCEALEKFNAESFDMVITDRVMPKMSGDQLAAAIREINPAEPIILLTGYEALNLAPEVSLLMNKPVTLASLRDAISRVMAA